MIQKELLVVRNAVQRCDGFEEVVGIGDGDGLVPRRVIALNAAEGGGPDAVPRGVEVGVHVEVYVEEMEGNDYGPVPVDGVVATYVVRTREISRLSRFIFLVYFSPLHFPPPFRKN
jgi:hypothetical protein